MPPVLVSRAALVAYALRWQGQGYVFGGNASRPGLWDCSSFVSFDLHGVGLGLPGGQWGSPGFPPNAHGPVVEDYASWNGAVPTNAPLPGDLVLWVGAGADGHMGIVTGPNQMVSALNLSLGTLKSPIEGYGPSGITPVYRRLTGAGGGVGVDYTTAAGGQSVINRMLLAALLTALVGAGVVAAAALTGTGLALLGAWAVRQATQ
jgi:cell wall-associated NlpC family hydrolase